MPAFLSALHHCTCQMQLLCVAHVQVLLDVLGLEELSDYLRLMCSSLQQHSRAVAAAATRPSTGSTAATAAGDPPGSSSILKTPGGPCVTLPCRGSHGKQDLLQVLAGLVWQAALQCSDIMFPAAAEGY